LPNPNIFITFYSSVTNHSVSKLGNLCSKQDKSVGWLLVLSSQQYYMTYIAHSLTQMRMLGSVSGQNSPSYLV